MEKFYKEFGLKKVLECGGTNSWDKVNVGNKVFLVNDFKKKYKLTGFEKQVGVVWKGNIVSTKEYKKTISKTINRSNGESEKVAEDISEKIIESNIIEKEEGSNDGIVIGVIPEEEGKFIKDFLEMGWDDDILFSAIISQNDSAKPLENRFKVAVYIEEFDFKKVQKFNEKENKAKQNAD